MLALATCFLTLPLSAQAPTGGNFVISANYLNFSKMSRSELDRVGDYGLRIPEGINIKADLDAEVGDVGPLSFRRYRIQMGPQVTHRTESFRLSMHALAGATKHRWGNIARNRELLFAGGSMVSPVMTVGGRIESEHALGRYVSVRGMRVDVSPSYYAGRWHREVKIGCILSLNLNF